MNEKILVIEDEKELSDMIVKKLEMQGFSTEKAETVEDALKILEKEKIDALWLDHYLSGDKNGFDLVSELKSQEKKLQEMSIFVVSNTAGPEEVEAYINLGINKYYVKSSSGLGEIVKELKEFFSARKSEQV